MNIDDIFNRTVNMVTYYRHRLLKGRYELS